MDDIVAIIVCYLAVTAEVVSSLSVEQSSEHIAQSSEHEVANDDCNNICLLYTSRHT